MTPTQKQPARTAADVAGDLDLSDEARTLLAPKLGAEAFFDALVKAELYPDAIRYTARLLTRYQAVWWGCLCVWHAARPADGSPGAAVLRAAVAWLRDPTDANRRAVKDVSRAAGAATPAGQIGYAVFLCEGSMAPAGQKDVLPEPHIAPASVANAVLGASRTGPAAGTAQRQKTFLTLAVDVYRGTNSWKGNEAHP